MGTKRSIIPARVSKKLNAEAINTIKEHPLNGEIGNQLLVMLELGFRIKKNGDVYINRKIKGKCPTLELTKLLNAKTETHLINITHDFKLKMFEFVR